MRVKEPISNTLLKIMAIIFKSHFKIYNTDDHLKTVYNKIIITDQLGFCELFVLINLADIKPIFLADEAIVHRYPFLFKSTTINPNNFCTLLVSLESLKRLDLLSLNEYAFLAYIAGKLRATIIPISIAHNKSTNTPFILSRIFLSKIFKPSIVEVLPSPKLYLDTKLNKKDRRQLNANSIYNVSSEIIYRSKNTNQTIFNALVEAAQRYGLSHRILEDSILGQLTYLKTLVTIRIFAKKIDDLFPNHKTIGVMLPNSCVTVISFFSIISSGKTPAMINYTSGLFNILNSSKAADISKIITSKSFIKHANMGSLIDQLSHKIEFIYIEDIKNTITYFDKVLAFFMKNYPINTVKPDDIAVILFTSGSEGKPKGVALSHTNILSNAAQTKARIHFDHRDVVLNILPTFHCFGLNIGLILPLISGVKIYLYPTPLHYKKIPEIIYNIKASIFFGTDTFLSQYAKFSHPEQYSSIRYIIAGAEKLKAKTRKVWKQNFNINVLEGYGVTETSPVISLSSPAFNKEDTAGLLLPKIEYFLQEVQGIKDGGRLFIKGPNVMAGYLHSDNPGTIQPLLKGWYDTGDIVQIDKSGFLSIKGRAKRFAKIGGEMVSLAAIDAFANELWPEALSASIAQIDNKKGQSITLLTTNSLAKLDELRTYAKSIGLTELYTPSHLVIVDDLPLLGSGKVDFTKLTEFVELTSRS